MTHHLMTQRFMARHPATTPTQPVRRRRTNPVALAIGLSALLAACSSPPLSKDYQRPELEVAQSLTAPKTEAALRSNSATEIDWLAWWRGFQDPVLNTLLEEASTHNQDLILASARIAELRASLAQTDASFMPSVDLAASATRKRTSENYAGASASASPYSNDRQVSLVASYELDFWGKYQQADQAARARLLAQSANRGTVLISLYANVAQSYFALRALDAQTQLAEQTLTTRREAVRLQKSRLAAGLVGELDLRQAESELAGIQITLQAAQQGRSNAEAALALLLGRSPRQIVQPSLERGLDLSHLYANQRIPANLPSDVLARRPDIASAEQNLIAAHADIATARAAYFPKLSITATVGQESTNFANLFDPASLFWSAIGSLAQPIFHGGAIDAQVGASTAREQQALAQYTQSVQTAFREVHDALNNAEIGQQLVTSSAQRIEALQSSLRLAQLRYQAGYSGYLEVLSAQRDLYQAQSLWVDSQRNQLASLVSLYKAFGGGWQASDMAAAATAKP